MFLLKKTYASLNSTSNGLYEMTDEDISKMHEVLLGIYDDLHSVCKKHALRLIAGGGTSLGAVRHTGFIPWDDDMDFNMPREDYERLIEVFENELGDRYDLLAPGYKGGANCFLMRVMKKGTTLLNMIDEASPYPTGIYIDICPIDYAPDSKLVLQVKGITADVLRFISYSAYWKQYESTSLREFMMNSDAKRYYQLRMLIGTVFSFRTAEQWFSSFDRFVRGKKSKHVTIAAGREKYRGAYHPIDVFIPPTQGVFNKRSIALPHEVDKYLETLYGDYMRIPEEGEREKHLCLMLDFENARKQRADRG